VPVPPPAALSAPLSVSLFGCGGSGDNSTTTSGDVTTTTAPSGDVTTTTAPSGDVTTTPAPSEDVTTTTEGSPVSDDWMDWECPGFPCMIVNYFEDPDKYTDIKQTCGPLGEFNLCQDMQAGKSFPTWFNGTINGWHNSTKPHPCANVNFGCRQSQDGVTNSCLQGDQKKCKSLCDDLELLDAYADTCTSLCEYYCPEETVV
jgi:hypothetical protein